MMYGLVFMLKSTDGFIVSECPNYSTANVASGVKVVMVYHGGIAQRTRQEQFTGSSTFHISSHLQVTILHTLKLPYQTFSMT